MLQFLHKISTKHIILLAVCLAVLIWLGLRLYNKSQELEPYKIGLIQSRTEVSEEDWKIVQYLIGKRLHLINRNGGIKGRPLEAVFIDDQGDSTRLMKLVKETVYDENLIAYIGAIGVWRALAMGPLITKEQVPYLGEYTYTHLTSQFPTMYASGLGVKEGTQVFIELLRSKATKVGFIGEKNAPNSETFLNRLKLLLPAEENISLTYYNLIPKGYQLSNQELKTLADSIREKTDFLIYTNEVRSIYPLLEAFEKYQVQVPVYCGLIDLAQLDATNPAFKSAELYDFNSLGIPGTHNTRLQQELKLDYSELQAKIKTEYQLGLAGSLADQIGLIAEAANDQAQPQNISVRSKINQALKKYINGEKVFRGWVNDLFFTEERALGGKIFVSWKPRNRSLPIMAPKQYFFSDTIIQETQVLYTSLDMARIDQINDEEKTFKAEFYLQIQSIEKLEINQIEFSNAVRNSIDQEPLIDIRLIRSRTDTSGLGFNHYLYKISGKFHFEPDLKSYPLDEQFFPISMQSSNALKLFLIQPSYALNRDTIFDSEGWSYQRQFVGFEQRRISSSGSLNSSHRIIPYYKFTFVYVLKRTSIDYFLKTLIPLFTILTIAYFSVFIPPREFEAMSAIQVTSLLSSIALYFSTYKPRIQYATASDLIFIFGYIMITTLLATSILIYIIHPRKNILKTYAKIYQRVVFPMIIIGFSIYIRWG